MSWFGDLFSSAGGGIIKAAADAIDTFVTTDKEKMELELRAKELDYKAINDENSNITQRWQADMTSDSWLSKNVRPMTLIYILSVYTLMAFSDGFGLKITGSYVELLGQWGMLIMSAYFGGRTIEKIYEMKTGKSDK